jgi:general secretion pathway protein D
MKKLNSSLLLAALLAGCQLQMRPLPGPVDFPRSEPPGERMLGKGEGPTERKMAVSAVAAAPAARPALPAAPVPTAITVDDEPVSIAIEQTALPMFVQILYGSVLKVPYTLDPTVTSRTDPVTFKTSQALPRSKVLQLADTLLRSYGLTAQEFGGLVRIAPVGATALTSIPAIRRSEGDVGLAANDQRQVFHYIETSVVRAAEMSQWLKQMLGTRVTLYEDNQNAFLLAGSTGDVRAALEVIRALDQPRMRGRFARRLTPANAAAPELAARLSEVLTAQGYSTALTASGSATVQILPIPSIGSIVVFAGTEAVLEHVVRWARELDQSPKNASTNNALFTYPVRFADAQDLARTLSELLGGVGGASVPAAAQGSPVGGAPAAAARSSSGGRVVVNNATNTLIFRGTNAEEQQQIRQLLLELDRPTKSAMIEVVVAELSVGALQRLGVQWTHNGLTSLTPARSATLGGSGLSISYTNAARDILAAIDALASDSNARVLSNPKVMARNGETASIQVGSEVPIVTTQQSTSVSGSPFPGVGTAGVLQQIQYRSTGVILNVRPVINSGNRLDLDVSQEVSSPEVTETGVNSSPTISTRRISTKLSLRDGSTVLLGGLISRNSSRSKSGVPLLKDIPLIGAAFRNQSERADERELLVMITPYVINDDFEAEEISAAVQRSFGGWAQELKSARVVRQPEPRATEPVLAPTPSPTQIEEMPTTDREAPLPSMEPVASGAADAAQANPTSAAASAGAPPPAPSLGPADQAVKAGAAAAAPAKTKSEKAQEGGGKKTATTKSREGGAGAAKSAPAGAGRAVTDPKLLEEFEKQVKKGR